MSDAVLLAYGFLPNGIRKTEISTGLINQTWKIDSGHRSYILQSINTDVFPYPQDLEHNISKLQEHIQSHHSGYFFPAPVPALDGRLFIEIASSVYRLYPFVSDSQTITAVQNETQAFEAAKQFGRYARNLHDLPIATLRVTIPGFHNLTKRFDEYKKCISLARADRRNAADLLIRKALDYSEVAATYFHIQSGKLISRRPVHHDAKISNVLFDSNDKGICVIDLDTTMPGYYISDLGDLLRTCLSPADENVTDFNAIQIRPAFFKAITDGYMEEMADLLTPAEKQYLYYSGSFMIYMQAIRFLTDYLMDDKYYKINYDLHNLDRAMNQLVLLEGYLQYEKEFTNLVKQ